MADEQGAPRTDEAGETKHDPVEEERRKWQGRLDRVLQEKKDLEAKLENAGQSDAQLSEKERGLQRRERVLTLALEKGIQPQQAFNVLFGDDDEARLDGLTSLIDAEAEARTDAEVARRFPKDRKPPQTGNLDMSVPTYDELLGMPEERLQQLPKGTIARAAERQTQGKGSLRSRVSDLVKGGRNG